MSDHAHGTPIPASSGLKQPYHLVDPSPWPLVGALGGALVVVGIILAAHFNSYATLVIGALIVFVTMFFWWRDVIRESRTPGLHSPVVRLGLRYGMMFFIASEVMFSSPSSGPSSILRCSRTTFPAWRTRSGRRPTSIPTTHSTSPS
jgi:cytochrome c oxidase subunit 3